MTTARSLSNAIDGIVIGASVGGVEALAQLLPAFQATTSAAIFVVLHLPRDRPSLLVEIFKSICALPVREADDKEPVAPGTIYFAPPDYHLLVDKGPALLLSADEPVHFARPSIDVLFESAADVYGPRLLGIILTGANADGATGLKAVHDAGGITMVQDPATALGALMPYSALQQSPADFILPLNEIRDLLLQFQGATE